MNDWSNAYEGAWQQGEQWTSEMYVQAEEPPTNLDTTYGGGTGDAWQMDITKGTDWTEPQNYLGGEMIHWPEKGMMQPGQRAQQGATVVQGTVIAQMETGRGTRWDEISAPTDATKGRQGKGSQYEQDRIQQLEGMLTTLFGSQQRRIEWSNSKQEALEKGKTTKGKATQTMSTWKGQPKDGLGE